jgi:hypothetical protein
LMVKETPFTAWCPLKLLYKSRAMRKDSGIEPL